MQKMKNKELNLNTKKNWLKNKKSWTLLRMKRIIWKKKSLEFKVQHQKISKTKNYCKNRKIKRINLPNKKNLKITKHYKNKSKKFNFQRNKKKIFKNNKNQ